MRRKLFTLCSAASLLLFVVTTLVWAVSGLPGGGARFEVLTVWPAERVRVSLVTDDTSFGIQASLSPDPSAMTPSEQAAWRARPRTYREWRQFGFRIGGGRWEDNLAGIDHGFDAGIPVLLAMPLLLLTPLAWARRRARSRRRARAGMCPSCGYDLRASPGRCPECGNIAAKPATA